MYHFLDQMAMLNGRQTCSQKYYQTHVRRAKLMLAVPIATLPATYQSLGK